MHDTYDHHEGDAERMYGCVHTEYAQYLGRDFGSSRLWRYACHGSAMELHAGLWQPCARRDDSVVAEDKILQNIAGRVSELQAGVDELLSTQVFKPRSNDWRGPDPNPNPNPN